jgi:signal transduction histidine kinase/CheY-like chemotaxis protein
VTPIEKPLPSVPHRDAVAVRMLWRTGRAMAILAGAVGVAVLFSWLGGPRFARSAGQPIEVAPVTAAALILASSALLLGGLRHRALLAVRRIAALIVSALAALRLLELAGAGDLRVDHALGAVHHALSSPDAHMLPATAATLLVAGLAMLLLDARGRTRRAAAQVVALALSPVPLVALVGYAYRVTLFYGSTLATAMALPTSVALLLLVIAIMLARPEEGFIAKLATAGTGSAMARRMLLYAMALPLALGWLALAMSDAGPSAAFAVSVVVVALTLVLVLLVLRDAAALDRMELAKERAQAERERSREELARALGRERDARGHAEAASRAKDEFLTTLSHELRTPLNAILGWSRLLRDGPPEPDRIERGLAVVERNGRALAHLVADLLDMSRIARGIIQLERTEVDLVSAVEAAVEAVRSPADAKGVRISRAVGDGVPRVVGDPARLQQIAWNLLSNAVKFTPAGGRVDVALSGDGERAVLTIEDTGAGIGPEFLPHVFDRFRQADGSPARAQGGLGLGLSLTRELVGLHGGTIEAASAGVGRGATFRVSLPGLPTLPEAAPPTPAWPRGRRLGGARILVVDDEPDSRDLLLQLLTSWGARASGAASARDALSALTRDTPDVLVSDIAMPGEDGFTLMSTLRAAELARGTPPLAAVALTAFARPEDRRLALQAGFDAHVAKPVEPEVLLTTLVGLLGRREPATAARPATPEPGPPALVVVKSPDDVAPRDDAASAP